MAKEKHERFEKVYVQGTMQIIEIWVDKETGVNYMFRANGYGGGLTVMVVADGKPIVSKIKE